MKTDLKMFLKPFRVKKQNTLKGSDRKKFKNDIGKLYNINEDILSDLFPTKGDMSVAKVELHNGDNAFIYTSQKNPIFFEINKQTYPTVYSLWKCPELLPVFITWPPVFTKLAVGADLMLPGVVVNGPVHAGTFHGIKKGDLASIRLVGNKCPVVVGETLLSGQDMYLSNMKGKGVRPIHMMGDLLWEMGDKSEPPQISDENELNISDSDGSEEEDGEINSEIDKLKIKDEDDEASENVEGATANISDSDETDSDSDTEEIDPKGLLKTVGEDFESQCEKIYANQYLVRNKGQSGSQTAMRTRLFCSLDLSRGKAEMDELLNYCCLCGLKGQVKKSDLPLSTGVFFKNFLQPYCPADKYIDIKKSTYKKLSKFLQTVEARGIIKVKEMSKGMFSITEVDKSHSDLKDLEVPEIVIPVATTTDDELFSPPVISDVFCIPSNLLPFFKSKRYSKGQGLNADEVRQSLTDYVWENDLQDPNDKSLIQLDPLLANIVLKKTENDVISMRWDLAKSRLFEKMQPAFQIKFPGKPALIKKGKVDPIKIDVVQRAGNKKVTLIDNVETFGIDPEKFAHFIQVKKACSTSVNPSIQKNKGLQILAQGNQVDFINDLLIEKYKLPIRYVEGLDKGAKKKKKKKR